MRARNFFSKLCVGIRVVSATAPILSVALVTTFLFFSPQAWSLQIAFLELIDAQGKRVTLEKKGRFGHLAISYRRGWIHAYPNQGVIWSPELKRFGVVTQFLENPRFPELSDVFVKKVLGLPYDGEYSWDSENAYYCSELIGKVLNIPPKPMDFSANIWRKHKTPLPWGKPGLSPDDIFIYLKGQPGWYVR